MTDPLHLLRARRAEIARSRKALDDEDAELIQAERIILRLTTNGNDGTGDHVVPVTQHDFIVATLRYSSNPWFNNVSELRDQVERQGKAIKMTTFQPLISFMTKKGTVVRDGPKVALATRVKGSKV